MKIILSTRNPSKALQIKTIFQDSPIEILTLDEADIEGEAVEDGKTLEENAIKKALYAFEKSGGSSCVMADDTGIFIKALNGEPGVISARWAGETATTEEITNYCLERLKGKDDRSAIFRTVVVLISPADEQHIFTGEIAGKILETPRCEPQPKMPYSPLFMPDGTNKVWAEMTIEEENKISHRGIAFRKVVEFFKN